MYIIPSFALIRLASNSHQSVNRTRRTHRKEQQRNEIKQRKQDKIIERLIE